MQVEIISLNNEHEEYSSNTTCVVVTECTKTEETLIKQERSGAYGLPEEIRDKIYANNFILQEDISAVKEAFKKNPTEVEGAN